jgi:4-hydroxybenzoate polyprenyltransferase
VRACFDLARSGNFPSVASNVLAALVLSRVAGAAWPHGGTLALAWLAGCLVYAGGATLNDVTDAAFDAQHRPERTIPRRIVTRGMAGVIGAVELAAGLGLLVAGGAAVAWVVALAATILAYDAIHKRWRGAVILMAGCRALLAGALATLPGQGAGAPFWWWVGALFVYIATLSLIARREYEVAPTGRAANLGRWVGQLLAFIPLIDAVALLLVGAWIPAIACAAAIPLGRWAQRVAAST